MLDGEETKDECRDAECREMGGGDMNEASKVGEPTVSIDASNMVKGASNPDVSVHAF
jgi:hypothetical protein